MSSLAMTMRPVPAGYAAHDVAGGREVRLVVVDDHVVEYARGLPALHGRTGQVEHEDAAGVTGRVVVVHVGELGVLDLDAGHVFVHVVAAHDDDLGLTHVHAGVAGAANFRILDEHVAGLYRVEAVGAVVLVRATRPLHADAAHGDTVTAHHLDGVPRSVLHREVFHHEVVAGGHNALRPGSLAGKVQHRAATGRHALAAQDDVVLADAELAGEMEQTRGQFDDRARLCLDERGQGTRLQVGAVLQPHQLVAREIGVVETLLLVAHGHAGARIQYGDDAVEVNIAHIAGSGRRRALGRVDGVDIEGVHLVVAVGVARPGDGPGALRVGVVAEGQQQRCDQDL
ncbi:MAG: hypothetical protein U5K56_10260 [Halioglobus sp.]|nr:hypothetical protein [Halioglobus sp.]